MALLIKKPTVVATQKGKMINEFVGRASSQTKEISIAHMICSPGWVEPGQTPDFDEFTVVLDGTLKVQTKDATLTVCASQGIHSKRGEWIRYSTSEGAEYIAICVPAFSPKNVHRDLE